MMLTTFLFSFFSLFTFFSFLLSLVSSLFSLLSSFLSLPSTPSTIQNLRANQMDRTNPTTMTTSRTLPLLVLLKMASLVQKLKLFTKRVEKKNYTLLLLLVFGSLTIWNFLTATLTALLPDTTRGNLEPFYLTSNIVPENNGDQIKCVSLCHFPHKENMPRLSNA